MATFNLSFTYPDGAGARLLDAFCAGAAYEQRKLPNETKAEFLTRAVKLFVKGNVIQGEADIAASAARQAAQAAAASELPIT